jgi:hypothetical protein
MVDRDDGGQMSAQLATSFGQEALNGMLAIVRQLHVESKNGFKLVLSTITKVRSDHQLNSGPCVQAGVALCGWVD